MKTLALIIIALLISAIALDFKIGNEIHIPVTTTDSHLWFVPNDPCLKFATNNNFVEDYWGTTTIDIKTGSTTPYACIIIPTSMVKILK